MTENCELCSIATTSAPQRTGNGGPDLAHRMSETERRPPPDTTGIDWDRMNASSAWLAAGSATSQLA
jgi:hypothetical protein